MVGVEASPEVQAAKAKWKAEQQARLASRLAKLPGVSPAKVAELLVRDGNGMPMRSLNAASPINLAAAKTPPKDDVQAEELFLEESGYSTQVVVFVVILAIAVYYYLRNG